MTPAEAVIGIYVFLNLVSLAFYAVDKHKAVEGKWRIRESTLIALGFIGPFGAVAGMKLFHHKTQKPKFKVNYLFLALHLLVIILLVAYYYR